MEGQNQIQEQSLKNQYSQVESDSQQKQSERKFKRITNSVRREAIKIFKGERGQLTNEVIAATLGISIRRVSSIRKQFNQTGTIKLTKKNKRSQGFQKKIAYQNQIICQAVHSDPQYTLHQIQQKLVKQDLWLSLTGISSRLALFGYNRRNPSSVMPQLRDQNSQIRQKHDFSVWISEKKNSQLYFTDYYQLQLPQKFIHKYTNKTIQHKIYIYLTIGVNGIVGWDILPQKITPQSLITHLQTHYFLIKDQNDIILIPPSQIACDFQIRQFCTINNIIMKYLPKQNEMNPIHNIYSQLKLRIYSLLHSQEIFPSIYQISECLDQYLADYAQKNIQKYYEEMRSYCKACQKDQYYLALRRRVNKPLFYEK